MSTNTNTEQRLLWLANIEEIKQLKARYARACDNDYEADTLAAMFTDDAVWDGAFMGRAEGKDGIREFFVNASSLVGFAVHGVSNPIIEINGDEASGHWYLHQPMVMKGAALAYWFVAQYEDIYVRTSDGWKFKSVLLKPRAFSPYEEGFGKTLMADLPV